MEKCYTGRFAPNSSFALNYISVKATLETSLIFQHFFILAIFPAVCERGFIANYLSFPHHKIISVFIHILFVARLFGLTSANPWWNQLRNSRAQASQSEPSINDQLCSISLLLFGSKSSGYSRTWFVKWHFERQCLTVQIEFLKMQDIYGGGNLVKFPAIKILPLVYDCWLFPLPFLLIT